MKKRQRSTTSEIFDAQPSVKESQRRGREEVVSQKENVNQACSGDSMSSPDPSEGVSASTGALQSLSIDDRAKLWGVSKKAYQGVVQQTLSQRIRSQTGDGQGLVNSLLDIVENGEDRDKIKAVELLLDRGWGRAVTPVVNLNDAAVAVAGRYGIDPGELASVAASLWNAQSGGSGQGEVIEILPERTDTETDE